MTKLEMWALILGFIAPVVIAIPQQPRLPKKYRALVTVVICIAIGFVTCWIRGDFTGKDVTTSALIVFVAAIAAYQGFWQHTGVTQLIERATSPGQQTPTTPAPGVPPLSAGSPNPSPGA